MSNATSTSTTPRAELLTADVERARLARISAKQWEDAKAFHLHSTTQERAHRLFKHA